MKKLFLLTALSLLLQFSIINVYADEPSYWAKNEVKEAIEKELVPQELQNRYTENITREEFCKLCIAVMKAWNGNFQYKQGSVAFSDTKDKDILSCAELGIVSGVGDNKFAPESPIKRQEAAKMLYNTLNIATPVIAESHSRTPIGFAACCVPHSFDDGGLIRDWARDEINHMYRFGVMLGVDDKNYNPDGCYTREQAICTFLRLYKCYGCMAENPIPENDYYPNGVTADNYISDGYFYAQNYDKETYTARYIDNEGNVYTQEDKGYVYPFDWDFAAFVTNVGAGVGKSAVVDKNGNICFTDTLYKEAEVTSGSALCVDYINRLSTLYRLPETEPVIKEEIMTGMGDNLYKVWSQENNSMGIVSLAGWIVNLNSGYISTDTLSLNNTFVLKKTDGNYVIMNSDGEILKEFSVEPFWEFKESKGSNIIFTDTKQDKEILYRAYSGQTIDDYERYFFTDNGEIIACGEYYHYYILNADGSVKFDAGKFGYKNVQKIDGFDFYKILKDNGESGLFDLVDKNGNVIKNDINTTLVADKSGVCAYAAGGTRIYFFDFFGKDIGSFDLSEAYGDEADGRKIKSIKFINGLLWTNISDDNGQNSDSFYVMPNGGIIDLE